MSATSENANFHKIGQSWHDQDWLLIFVGYKLMMFNLINITNENISSSEVQQTLSKKQLETSSSSSLLRKPWEERLW